jgi:hypothetical protein
MNNRFLQMWKSARDRELFSAELVFLFFCYMLSTLWKNKIWSLEEFLLTALCGKDRDGFHKGWALVSQVSDSVLLFQLKSSYQAGREPNPTGTHLWKLCVSLMRIELCSVQREKVFWPLASGMYGIYILHVVCSPTWILVALTMWRYFVLKGPGHYIRMGSK